MNPEVPGRPTFAIVKTIIATAYLGMLLTRPP
jgi:hypothetical protein